MGTNQILKEIEEKMIYSYKKGYREGFDDFKKSTIIILENKDINIDQSIKFLKELDYEN